MKQIKKLNAFSLVEVTLAMGVAGFCLLAVFALLPIGVKSNQTAFSQTAAATILSDIVADMRAAGKNTTSAQYAITFGTRKDLCFDSEGGFADCTNAAPPANARYRAVVGFPIPGGNPPYATVANIKVSWPAPVNPSPPPNTDVIQPAGIIETVAAFDRF